MKKQSVSHQVLEIEETSIDMPAQENASKKTIGYALATMREKKAVDIASVATTLNISERYLWAIENMDRNSLPEKVYTLGFVRTYARYLGVDPQKSVDQFKKEVFGDSETQNLNMPEPLSPIEKPKLALVLSMGAMAVGGWFFYQYLLNDTRDVQVPEVQSNQSKNSVGSGENSTIDFASSANQPNELISQEVSQAAVPNVSQPIPMQSVGDQWNGQAKLLPVVLPAPDDEEGEESAGDLKTNDETVKLLPAGGALPGGAYASKTDSKPTQGIQKVDQNGEKKTVLVTGNHPLPASHPKLDQVTFSFQDKTWMEIKKGAQVLINKKFLPGESYSFPMSADLTISTLNSKGFTVHYQGDDYSLQNKGQKFNNMPLHLVKESPQSDIPANSPIQE